MADVESHKPELTPRQEMIRLVGRMLWRMNLDPSDDTVTPEVRRADWKEHRLVYIQAARRIIRKLEKKGLKVARSDE